MTQKFKQFQFMFKISHCVFSMMRQGICFILLILITKLVGLHMEKNLQKILSVFHIKQFSNMEFKLKETVAKIFYNNPN